MKIKLTDIPCFYINLDGKDDRAKATETLLLNLGFKNITRVSGVWGTGNNPHVHGCAMGHIKALQLGKQLGKPFIIFEDDIDIKIFQDEFEVPDNTDVVYLGTNIHSASEKGRDLGDIYDVGIPKNGEMSIPIADYPGIYKIVDMLTSHAILYVSSDYVEDLIRYTEHGIYQDNPVAIDITMAKLQFKYNVYATNEPIFWQNTPINMINQVRTIHALDTHKDLLIRYPHFYEYLVDMAQQQVFRAIEFKKAMSASK